MPGVFIILLMLLLGNGLSWVINGIIPGSVIGMVLLFLALLTKIVKPDMIRKPAGYLINHMSLFFIPALTAVIVVLVGVFGGIIGPWVLRKLGVESHVARGLAMGTGAHGLGMTKAIELGAVEGAIGGLAIVLMVLMTAILIPILNFIAAFI